MNPDKALNQIRKEQNLAGAPLVDEDRVEDYQIQLVADESVGAAKFLPSKVPGIFRAHPLTIESIRLDVFVLGGDLDVLKSPYQCPSCNNHMDQQFWKKCPYCGRHYDK